MLKHEKKIKKKIIVTLLAAAVILQVTLLTSFAEAADAERMASGRIENVSMDRIRPGDIVIERSDISIKDGKYSFRLVLRARGGLTFDNDLEIYYQGVDGKYKLHYEIDADDNHIMVVTGTFDNILVASPLLKKIRDRIGEDSYFYRLILKTDEILSFTNKLSFLLDGNRQEYSYSFDIDLPHQSRTEITGITASRRALTVKWTDSSGADGFIIQYSTDKEFKKGTKTKFVKGGSRSSVRIKSLKKGKEYFVRIRSYRIVSGHKDCSEWSDAVSAKVK